MIVVGGIPIAMPTVLSVTLALGAYKLAREGAIVARMSAVEEMAGMDILCSDKTGALPALPAVAECAHGCTCRAFACIGGMTVLHDTMRQDERRPLMLMPKVLAHEVIQAVVLNSSSKAACH